MAHKLSFLTLEQVVAIHDNQIELYGGRHGLRDLRLLESALMRPQATFGGEDFYPSLFDKAAVLMHSVILNHPFNDGNKRTGTVSALVFLEFNAYSLLVNQKQLERAALNVESKKWNIEKIANWLKKHSRKI